MNEGYLGRTVRLIRSGLTTPQGLLIVLAAIVAVFAIVVDDSAARLIGLVCLAATTLAVLALIGRLSKSTQPPTPIQPKPSPTKNEDTAVETALEAAREHLVAMAARLELPESGSAPVPMGKESLHPLITVIVPVFNDERYVQAALDSIRQQSYQSWECVIVDDASTDSSFELVEASIAPDHRFRSVRHETNLGPGAARNRGIAEAKGSYIAFLDADDLLLRESLSDRVAALAEKASDPYVIGSFCAVRFSPENVTLEELPDRRHATQHDFVDFVTADAECPFTMIAPLVSAAHLRSVGGFDESMRSGGVDWDLWYRILRNGHVFVPSRTLGAVYRQRGGGITRGNPAAHTMASANLIQAAYRTAPQNILSEPSPYPMMDPLPAYHARLVVAERAIRFGAMALVDGDRGGMTATLSVLEPGTWPLLERHLDIGSLVARGAARVLGVQPRHLDTLGPEMAPFVGEVESAVRSASK